MSRERRVFFQCIAINPDCTVDESGVSSIALSASDFPFGVSQVALSPATSACQFAVVTSGVIFATLPFAVVPLTGCAISGTPVIISNSSLGAANVVAISPDGKDVAIAYRKLATPRIQIYSVNSVNCSLSANGLAVPIAGNPQSLNYSPDGSCLACLSDGGTQIFPVQADGTLGLVSATIPQGSGAATDTVIFSPQSTDCNLLALTNSQVFPVSAFIYSRNSTPLAAIAGPSTLTVCQGTTLVLNAVPVAGGTYSWNTPQGIVNTGTSPQLQVSDVQPLLNSGQYTVTVTLNGCTSAASAPVTVSVVPCNTTLAITEFGSTCVSRCGSITYTISIQNTGSVAAMNLQLIDLLPSCLTFVSGTGANWSFMPVGQQVTAKLSDSTPLQPGATTSLTITAQAHHASGKKITNTITVSADNVSIPQVSHRTTCVK